MELIERYLQAVKFALPQAQQDDIIKELRDNILSQIEDKEAELGRPLAENEQVELLKKIGSPMQLASRYRKHQYLIGATMFPIYSRVLKVALGLALVVLATASIATAAAGKTFTESLGVLSRLPGVALTVFAWVTLAFSAVEIFGGTFRVNDCWDPRHLPPLMKDNPRKSNFELITQMLVQTTFGIWWLAGLHYQYLILGPAVYLLRFGPVWQTIYPLFVLMVVADLMLAAARLVWPGWTQGRSISRLVISGLGLIVFYFLINAPELFVVVEATAPQLQTLVKHINYGIRMGLLAFAVVNVVNIVREAIRLIGGRLGHVHQATVGS